MFRLCYSWSNRKCMCCIYYILVVECCEELQVNLWRCFSSIHHHGIVVYFILNIWAINRDIYFWCQWTLFSLSFSLPLARFHSVCYYVLCDPSRICFCFFLFNFCQKFWFLLWYLVVVADGVLSVAWFSALANKYTSACYLGSFLHAQNLILRPVQTRVQPMLFHVRFNFHCCCCCCCYLLFVYLFESIQN